MGRNHEKCGPLIDNVASILDKQASALDGMPEDDPQGKRARFANGNTTLTAAQQSTADHATPQHTTHRPGHTTAERITAE